MLTRNTNNFVVDWNYGVRLHCNNFSFEGSAVPNTTDHWKGGLWDPPFLIVVHEYYMGRRHFLCAVPIGPGTGWHYKRRIRSWWDIDVYSWQRNKGYIKLFSETFNDRNKMVRIKITTDSATDAIAWTEIVEEYKKVSGATVVMQTAYNDQLNFFDFVDGWEEYGVDTYETYASYDIGRFYESPENFHTLNRTFDGNASTRRFYGWMNPRKVDRWDVHDVARDVLLSSGERSYE